MVIVAAFQIAGVVGAIYFGAKGKWLLAAASLGVAYVAHKGGPANVIASFSPTRHVNADGSVS